MTLYYTYLILATSCDRLLCLPTCEFPHAHLDTCSITSLSKCSVPCFSVGLLVHVPLHFHHTFPTTPCHATSFAASCISSCIPCYLSATYQIISPATSPVTGFIHCYACHDRITSYDLCYILSTLRVSNTLSTCWYCTTIGTDKS